MRLVFMVWTYGNIKVHVHLWGNKSNTVPFSVQDTTLKKECSFGVGETWVTNCNYNPE